MSDNYKEFLNIATEVLENKEFQKTKNKVHHGITRYDHLLRVGYYSYLTTKKLRLNYKETTRAALLHDFFLDEVEELSTFKALQKHPLIAVENSKKYFDLTDREEDIIKTHMFPVTFIPPRYIESVIVDIVDDIASIYERSISSYNFFKVAIDFLLIFVVNMIESIV